MVRERGTRHERGRGSGLQHLGAHSKHAKHAKANPGDADIGTAAVGGVGVAKVAADDGALTAARGHEFFVVAFRIAAVAILALLVCAVFSGCRSTDVWTQKIIDPPGVSETDYSLEPWSVDEPEQNQEEQNKNREEEEDNQEQYEKQDEPDYSENEPTTQQEAEQHVFENSAQAEDDEASSGGANDGSDGDAPDADRSTVERGQAESESNSAQVGSGGDDAQHAGGNGSDTSETQPGNSDVDDGEEAPRGRTITIPPTTDYSDEPQPEDDSPEPEDGGTSKSDDSAWDPPTEGGSSDPWNPAPSDKGDGGTDSGQDSGSTYADGTYDTIPSVGKVAAAGPYATIVQSLGGKGALAAAPQQWLDNLPSSAYSNGAELVDVKGISSWGDGTNLTDAAVQDIIESGAECVLTSNTYNSMNQNQAEKLNDAGVDVLVMPDIGADNTLDSDIVMTVDVVGELLRDAGTGIQFNAKTAATEWKRQHNLALEDCYVHNGGYTYLQWGAGALENYLYQGQSGTARALYNRRSDSSLHRNLVEYVDDWSSSLGTGLANHIHSSSDRNSYDLIDYYFQHSGLVRGSYQISQQTTDLKTEGGRFVATAHVIEIDSEPMQNQYGWLSTPVIIARNEALARNVASSASSSTSSPYNLGYDYYVWVMPADADGSWNDGTFSSFLVAPWAYSMVNGHGTSDADAYVNDFYDTFYRDGAANLVTGYGSKVYVTCAK